MMVLYHSLVSILFAAALPVLPLVWVMSEKRRANLLQRLGFFTGFSNKAKGSPRIWVHALSVGEVNSCLPLVQGLKKRRPNAEIILTASTRTGFQTACRLLGPESDDPGLVSQMGYFPFDFWFSVKRVLSAVDPDLVILVETDLWPGFISMAGKRGIPVILANARLSSEAHKGYRRFSPVARKMFSTISHTMAQTQRDAGRFISVGVKENRISVTGNIKFDRAPLRLGDGAIEEIRADLGLGKGQRAWIAGSTHGGEEEMLVKALDHVRHLDGDLKLILAPRDPGRSRALAEELGRGPYNAACLSDSGEKKARADILLIDRIGVLLTAYAAGSLAFVGGSLVDQGGHNPLEPAMFGKPVLFGPHMEDFHEVARMLAGAGGAEQVHTVEDLAIIIERLLGDRAQMERMGLAAQDVFSKNSGAVGRTVEIMEAGGFV